MSDQYQDAAHYLVYFVLGAIVGAFWGNLLFGINPDFAERWTFWVGGAVLGGSLSIFFGDRFWDFIQKFFR